MMGIRIAWLTALLVGCAGGGKEAPPPQAPSNEQPRGIPADLREPVERSIGIGARLYVLDKVSAVATDALLAEVSDPRERGIAGYLPFQEGDENGQPQRSFLVTFFTQDAPPQVAAEVRVAPDTKPVVETFSPPKEMLPALVPFARARQTAIAALPSPTQPLNPVILPAEAIGEQGILVYLLAGTTKPDVAVMGRHFQAVVSPDGARVLRLTPLSKSVLEIPTRAATGETTQGIAVSHLVTDYPLETHVFVSLLMKLPVYVGTRRGMWRVEGDRIDFLGDQPPAEKP